MSRTLYVDVVGGAAGDMLLAALLDAGVPQEPVWAAIEAVLPGRFDCRIEPVRRGGLRAAFLQIDPEAGQELEPRTLGGLLGTVGRARLPAPVAATARTIIERLGEAEARVHGAGVGDAHAVGDDDTLLDVVGVSAALVAAGVDRVLVSTVPLESEGWLPGRGEHPPIPLPAPATLELLRGFRTRRGGPGEVVTPTAAAILAALGTPADGFPEMSIEAIGYGAGTKDPPDRANVVRIVLGADTTAAAPHGPGHAPVVRDLVVLEANLDDLTPELVADAVQALLSAGALDAWTTPVLMKKGRPGVVLSALGELDAEARLRSVFFEATSTFGVRASRVLRAELERRTVSVDIPDGSLRVKVGLLGGRVVSATPEHDDVAAVAARAGRPVRHVYEEAAAAAQSAWLAPTEP